MLLFYLFSNKIQDPDIITCLSVQALFEMFALNISFQYFLVTVKFIKVYPLFQGVGL